MKKYRDEIDEKYPDRNPNEPPFLIHCSAKVKASRRVEYENTHTHKEGVPPKYGIAKYPEAVKFFFDARDPPTY
jgi:hypothetical protein